MKRLVVLGLLALVGAILATAASAQVPDKFTNLQVFPKDTGKQELIGAMRNVSGALGVRCTYCHVEKVPGDHSTIDWASDELAHKKVAREMMKMAHTLNAQLLPQATGEDDVQISCVTCHRGLTDPATLDQVMVRVAGKDGVDAAIAKYRELRDQYYGSGSYDFSPETLGTVAETLAQKQGDMAGATKVVDLNIEMNPQDAEAYVMKAQLQLASGDQAGATASLDKALTIDPQSRAAQQMRKQLGE